MPVFTVCIPSYNAEKVIGATVESLLKQTFGDWECLIVDDASTDDTEAVVRLFTDPRIAFIKNDQNLGCAGNFQRCRDLATGNYIFFLANDDLLSPQALERTHQAFQAAPDIALVARPYYWFKNNDPTRPIRYTSPLDPKADRIISVHDDDAALRALLDTLGQVSGLAFRNDALTEPFNKQVWTTHIQPFLATLKTHRAVFLHDYLLAVRLEHSQARTLPKIYDPSPLWTWVSMLREVFPGKQWARQRRVGIDNITHHVEGLVQLRCHSTMKCFLREAWLYAAYRPLNLLSLRYWFFALGCLTMPPRMLRRLVDRHMAAYTQAQTMDIAMAC
jgi:glycosyltransferase involved in cell wall biosynthesis